MERAGQLFSKGPAKPLPAPSALGDKDAFDGDARAHLLHTRGATVWVTSRDPVAAHRVAVALESRVLRRLRASAFRVDDSTLLKGLNQDIVASTPSAARQRETVRRAAEVAALMSASGTVAICAVRADAIADRDFARELHRLRGLSFVEVYVVDKKKGRGDADRHAGAADTVGASRAGSRVCFSVYSSPDSSPFEPPVQPAVTVVVDDIQDNGIQDKESLNSVLTALERAGVGTGEANPPSWYPVLAGPDGVSLGGEHPDPPFSSLSKEQAKMLPSVLLTDIDLHFTQVIGEGWASPLRGFMREGTLLQALHFNSILVDPFDENGRSRVHESKTDFSDAGTGMQSGRRVSMPIPIVLPIHSVTRDKIRGARQVVLVAPDGQPVAILSDPEVYPFRKEEVISRVFGGWDRDHPFISHWMQAGDYLLGGEVALLGRIRYNDGLDKYRLTPSELRAAFSARGADAVFAFQTRNPTHAGHAHLMATARKQLVARGFRKPVLWLSPLGGWSKADDVPLDVRVRQHVAVMESGMLPADTVLAIWPSPMLYAGPTEVQWHAKARRNAGARFFITGRDPAGIKRSASAGGGDFYKGDHGRYVLQASPGLGSMDILSFGKVFYDVKDGTMKPRDPQRMSDFLSVSGTRVRAMAAAGRTECKGAQGVPPDWETTLSCVPPGFMAPRGWSVLVDYYKNPSAPEWIRYSRLRGTPLLAGDTKLKEDGQFGTLGWSLSFQDRSGGALSPWHDVPLGVKGDPLSHESAELDDGSTASARSGGLSVNVVFEIPKGRMEKLEMVKEAPNNPIRHVPTHDNAPRYLKYGVTPFNYGFLPQTWEAPGGARSGDGDPVDAIEIGVSAIPIGSVVRCRVVGVFEVIDRKETDYKLVVIAESDPDAAKITSPESLEAARPGAAARLADWLRNYKIAEGKPAIDVAHDGKLLPATVAARAIRSAHVDWNDLSQGKRHGPGYYLSGGILSQALDREQDPSKDVSARAEQNKTDVKTVDAAQSLPVAPAAPRAQKEEKPSPVRVAPPVPVRTEQNMQNEKVKQDVRAVATNQSAKQGAKQGGAKMIIESADDHGGAKVTSLVTSLVPTLVPTDKVSGPVPVDKDEGSAAVAEPAVGGGSGSGKDQEEEGNLSILGALNAIQGQGKGEIAALSS